MLGHKIDIFSQSLFLDLYRIAIVDGILESNELRMMYRIGEERGVSIEEIQEIIRNPGNSKEKPILDADKIQYLMDVSKIIISDSTIKDEELYLWDKVALKILGEESDIEQVKKAIFKRVVDKYIEKEEKRVESLRLQLCEELEDKILSKDSCKTVNEISDSIKDSIKHANPDFPNIEPPTIFMLGMFKLSKQQIRSIFRPIFLDAGITLNNKSFKFAIDKDYTEIKSGHKTLITNATNGVYDLLIYGPHPHNVHGFGQKTWENVLENTGTSVFGDHSSPPSKSKMAEYARCFINDKLLSLEET